MVKIGSKSILGEHNLMERRVRGNSPARCGLGENLEITSKSYLSTSLGLAADAAREGDFVKCSMYVDGIASVFFPLDGGEDPLWPNAANNAFKRTAYGNNLLQNI